MRRFVPTPVRVELAPNGAQAFSLLDADGIEFFRVPAPFIPNSSTRDPVAFACARDIARQFNEFGALLEQVIIQLGQGIDARVGLEVTVTPACLMDWDLAISMRDRHGNEFMRITQRIDRSSYARDATDIYMLVRKTRRALRQFSISR